MDQNFRHEWAPCHFKQLVYFYVYSEKFTNHGETAWPVDHTPME